jgi:DmsE family decaheme c-type cytochrome
MRSSSWPLTLGAVSWAAVVSLVAAAGPRASVQTPTPPPAIPQAVAPSTAQPGAFAGDDTCTACHEAEGKTLQASLHGKAQNARTPAARPNQACETCHGPGKEHAETGDKTKIRVFTAIAPRDASEVCTSCHNRGAHGLWKGSAHDARNLTCVTCHSVHNPKSQAAQLKSETVTGTCKRVSPAGGLQASALRPHAGPRGQDGMLLVPQPHGSNSVRLLKTGNWINESCASCPQTEKRGPYLWDHAPVREACSTCHDPHGSNQERLLVAKLPMLCQRCTHRHAPSPRPSTTAPT